MVVGWRLWIEKYKPAQPTILCRIFSGNGWSIESTPNILVNWNATSGNAVTYPIGVSIAKVVKLGPLPVKFALEVQYMPVHPNLSGEKWNVQLKISPVVPKLIKEGAV